MNLCISHHPYVAYSCIKMYKLIRYFKDKSKGSIFFSLTNIVFCIIFLVNNEIFSEQLYIRIYYNSYIYKYIFSNFYFKYSQNEINNKFFFHFLKIISWLQCMNNFLLAKLLNANFCMSKSLLFILLWRLICKSF